MKNLHIIIIVVILANSAGHTVWADCTGGNPEAWLNVYWNNDPQSFGDEISYHAYYEDGEYKLAVTDVGGYWDDIISSIECFDNYPAHWLIYDGLHCADFLLEGDGSTNLSGSNNDAAASLKFRCPSDKDVTWFTFCEHENCGGKAHQIRLYKHGNSYEVVWEVRQLDGHWNDNISAVESAKSGTLPKANAYWYFYRDKDFNSNGNADLILKNNNDFMYVGDDLNDKITSFRLVISNSEDPPTVQSQSIPGDIDCDGSVGYFDLAHLVDSWLQQDCDWCKSGGDLNADQQVNFSDFAVLAEYWLETLPI